MAAPWPPSRQQALGTKLGLNGAGGEGRRQRGENAEQGGCARPPGYPAPNQGKQFFFFHIAAPPVTTEQGRTRYHLQQGGNKPVAFSFSFIHWF